MPSPICKIVLPVSAVFFFQWMNWHSAYADDLSANIPPANTSLAAPERPVDDGLSQKTESSDGVRLNVLEENDYFASNNDRDYTQGAKLSFLTGRVTPNGTWDQPFHFLSSLFPIFDGADRKRKYDVTIAGQSLFTPTNLQRVNPSLKDRPYAAWLYTGASMLQDTDRGSYHTLENAEVLMGVVGPAALGGVTQNDFHQFIGVTSALGWQNQLHNEPGFMLSYDRKWRFQQPLISNLAIDAIPEGGITLGNVLTYGQVGGIVRIGQNLAADYGPNRIRPSQSGTAWFDPGQLDGSLGWYFFAGAQGRAIGHSIFLDGNTYSSSPSIDKKPLVADYSGGVSLFWSSAARADFTVTQRTKEFYGQKEQDRFGGINLAVGF